MATDASERPSHAVSRPLRVARPAVTAMAAAVAVVPLAACQPTSSSYRSSTSSSTTVVVISAADDVCWEATVDGRERKGCGDAEFTDRSGRAGAKVVKTTEGSRVRVRLVVDGQTVDTGSVRGQMHYVSVTQSSED